MKTFDINKIQLKIQSPNITVNGEFNDYILGQIEKLGKTYSRIERCEMMLKDEKSDNKKNCSVEAKIFVPGNVLFASDKNENFRQASKAVFEDLNNQLLKFKGKINDVKISK
jgi:ribosomal subunit interface protein